MNHPPLSVIIPCYNQGNYLKDALDSLMNCNQELFETIIVNDGSTDANTVGYLHSLREKGWHVIFQKNCGLGHARNTGIQHAKGAFILPLDADNRIYPGYILKGLELLQANKELAVVYAKANYFGDKVGILAPGPFNLQRLMLGNYIDACAIIRKSVIEEVGFYDNMKIMGYEDWDLWLRIAFRGYKFSYIDDVLFEYRVTKSSMMRTLNADIQRQNEIEQYFINKYPDKLSFETVQNYFVFKMKKSPFRFFYKLILKKYFPAYYTRLINENKIYRGFLYDRI
jgi:glycosyltransferase involved in cell wall biosynthesis